MPLLSYMPEAKGGHLQLTETYYTCRSYQLADPYSYKLQTVLWESVLCSSDSLYQSPLGLSCPLNLDGLVSELDEVVIGVCGCQPWFSSR